MIAMNDIPLNSCHLPDEYVDAAISLDCETSEASASNHRPVRDVVVPSFVRCHWLRNNTDAASKQGKDGAKVKNELKLSTCDLPDEYVDATVLSFDDSDSRADTLHLAGELLGSISSLACLNHGNDHTFDIRSDTSDVILSDYDLPDEYVSPEVSIEQRESLQQGATSQREQSPESESLDAVDARVNRILSLEPHVGLSRRRRKYESLRQL